MLRRKPLYGLAQQKKNLIYEVDTLGVPSTYRGWTPYCRLKGINAQTLEINRWPYFQIGIREDLT